MTRTHDTRDPETFTGPAPGDATRKLIVVHACWRAEGTEHAQCATAPTLADARRIVNAMKVRHAAKESFAVHAEIHHLRRDGTAWRLEQIESLGAHDTTGTDPDRHLAAARATLKGRP